jgi:hypothetical protein
MGERDPPGDTDDHCTGNRQVWRDQPKPVSSSRMAITNKTGRALLATVVLATGALGLGTSPVGAEPITGSAVPTNGSSHTVTLITGDKVFVDDAGNTVFTRVTAGRGLVFSPRRTCPEMCASRRSTHFRRSDPASSIPGCST